MEFGTPYSKDEFARWRRRLGPPDNELPVPVPFGGVLGRTDEFAVALAGAWAYRHGVAFAVTVRTRRFARGNHEPGLFDLVDGVGSREAVAQRLLMGVELADGRRVLATSPFGPDADDAVDDTEPVLAQGSGNGSERVLDLRYWLTPLPPRGPLQVVCTWPAVGLSEGRLQVDAGALVDAAAGAQELWPWEPEAPPPPPGPVPPDVPGVGWFGWTIQV